MKILSGNKIKLATIYQVSRKLWILNDELGLHISQADNLMIQEV